MFHLADAWATFAITAVGGRHVMVRRFDPEGVMRVTERERVTISNLIPTMLNLMTKHERISSFDFSSLRVLLSGGAPIAPEVVKSTMQAFGCDYIQTYGMTETSPVSFQSGVDDPLEKRVSTVGRIHPHVEVKAVGPDGATVAVGKPRSS